MMKLQAYRCADLQVISPNRITVVHCVKSGDFVNAHRWHLEDARNLIHDADTCPAVVLALTEIQQWHDGGFLVLAWVSGEDFLDETLVDLVEFERDVGVVVGCIAVLDGAN